MPGKMEVSLTDRVTLKGLRVYGKHGVLNYERQYGQDFVIDVTVWANLDKASKTDNLVDTFDYNML